LVGDGVFVKEAMVFFDQRFAELGGEGGFFDAEMVGFAGEDLFEVSGVSVHGMDAARSNAVHLNRVINYCRAH
jgi:hypothetical protein